MIELQKLACLCDFSDFLDQELVFLMLTHKQLLSKRSNIGKSFTIATTVETAVLESRDVKKTVSALKDDEEYVNPVLLL